VGDEVVLIGRGEEEEITADDLARWSGTINYEVVARAHDKLPRFLVDHEIEPVPTWNERIDH
jgi:alanine racemase